MRTHAHTFAHKHTHARTPRLLKYSGEGACGGWQYDTHGDSGVRDVGDAAARTAISSVLGISVKSVNKSEKQAKGVESETTIERLIRHGVRDVETLKVG